MKGGSLLLCLGLAVVVAGCSTTGQSGSHAAPPTTATAPTPTTSPVSQSSTTTDIPQMTLPPATTTTAAVVMCSLTVLKAEAYPTCQQTYGQSCTTQQVEDIGRKNYGCQSFGP